MPDFTTLDEIRDAVTDLSNRIGQPTFIQAARRIVGDAPEDFNPEVFKKAISLANRMTKCASLISDARRALEGEE